jgi:pimeloyl-ACP methyl ester carboxylesterase
MSDWFSGEIVAHGTYLHYTLTGGDKPPVVLAHGSTEGSVCWTRVARSLESEFDVIMVDARHHPDVVGPGVVGRVVLEDPPWGPNLKRTPEQVEATVATHKKYRVMSTQELAAFFRGRMPAWSDEECTLLAEAKYLLPVEAIRGYQRTEHDWREVARSITCPLLLITANHKLYRDRNFQGRVTPEVAQEAMALLPNAHHVKIDTAGHCIHREQQEKTHNA